MPKFQGETIPYIICGYTGPQLRAAYEQGTSFTGNGATVAITDAYAAPTIASDANRYAEAHGDGSYAPGQLVQSLPSAFNSAKKCSYTGWYGEETLDVEAVHAMAPLAKIHYYASASCFDNDFLDTLARVVDDNDAQIVSNSWSDVEQNESADNVKAYETVFLQGAMQGISFVFSSGDNGDELNHTGLKQVDYPSSDPYATGAGGTSTAIGASGQLLWQSGWGDYTWNLAPSGKKWISAGFTAGAGGGRSSLFPKPAYQDGIVQGASRGVPDIAMDADNTTGFLIGETQKFTDGVYYDEFRLGGTSLASPLFAGMTALAIQHAKHGGGLLNPTIYKKAATAFNDIKNPPKDAGNVRVNNANGQDPSDGLVYLVRTFDQDTSLATGKGWDDVTGVGNPTPGWFTALG